MALLKTQKLSDAIGLEILGADFSQPIPDAVRQQISDAFDEYGLLVFRDQKMTKQNLVDASRCLGETEIHPLESIRDAEVPEIIVLASQGKYGVDWGDGDRIVGRQPWHTDTAYTTTPCRGAMFYGVNLPPEGGETGFIDCQKAYDGLDHSTKARIDNLHVLHSWRYMQSNPGTGEQPAFKMKDGSRSPDADRFPDVIYPLVIRHPVTGRKILNAVPAWAAEIVEMRGQPGYRLIDRLIAHATSRDFTYWHSYRPGDLIAWDNWRTNHAAAGSKVKYNRTMWRTTIKGNVAIGRELGPDVAPSVRESAFTEAAH